MTDPITIAVLQHRLNAIAEEMGEAMLRTAYSQILNSSRDFSIALIDAKCRLVAQADHIPVHVGAMPWAAKALAARFPNPCPSDVYLLNDPYRGGSPLPALTVFVPGFALFRAGFRADLSADVRWSGANVLVGGSGTSFRHRRGNAWCIQCRGDG